MKTPVTRKTVTGMMGGAAALLATAVLLSGCTSPKPTATTAAPSSAAPTATETPAAPSVAPLTGLPVDSAVTNASLASKIDNLIDARPQIGLQYTDMVYEELVEGGITRYVAVWQSHIPNIYGPVRSIRGMDPAIVSPLGGIISYSGGQNIFVDGIKATKVVNVSHDTYSADHTIFYRTQAKQAPHNVIAKGKNIVDRFGKGVEAPEPQFTFAADAASSTAGTTGEATKTLTAKFSDISTRTWDWDDAKQVWNRSQNGVADKDDKGGRLTAVNVVTIRVGLKTISHTPVSQLVGSGDATFSSAGKTAEGTWKKGSLTDPIELTDSEGNPVTLTPGNTWIELVATGGSVSHK